MQDICTSPILKRLVAMRTRCNGSGTHNIFDEKMRLCTLHVNAAVHVQHVPGNETCFFAHEKLDGSGDLSGVPCGAAESAQSFSALSSSLKPCVISVSMKPGATALTVMLRLPISWASDFVNPIKPAFDAT